ncbi:MAG: ASPIC/UnbV domain-containing protein, partial [Planctomycetia bacterium]
LENVAPRRGHWLAVRARVGPGRRDAHGAVVTVEAAGRRWRRVVQPGSSYLSSHAPACHFGLGPIDTVDAVEIRWPDGRSERFGDGFPVDRSIELVQGAGTAR